MKRFHFSLGNSSKGPIGFCATVTAEDMNDAVKKLKAAVAWLGELDGKKASGMGAEHPDVDYLQIYLNANAITCRSIDDEEGVPVQPEAR